MNLLNIIATITPINEFGQNPAHDDFNVWVNFLMLFLWPLLIFISYKFISYTMGKLETSGYFDNLEEEKEEVQETKEVKASS